MELIAPLSVRIRVGPPFSFKKHKSIAMTSTFEPYNQGTSVEPVPGDRVMWKETGDFLIGGYRRRSGYVLARGPGWVNIKYGPTIKISSIERIVYRSNQPIPNGNAALVQDHL